MPITASSATPATTLVGTSLGSSGDTGTLAGALRVGVDVTGSNTAGTGVGDGVAVGRGEAVGARLGGGVPVARRAPRAGAFTPVWVGVTTGSVTRGTTPVGVVTCGGGSGLGVNVAVGGGGVGDM